MVIFKIVLSKKIFLQIFRLKNLDLRLYIKQDFRKVVYFFNFIHIYFFTLYLDLHI